MKKTISHKNSGGEGKVRRLFRVLGPGLITGASDDDPSGIGTYSVAGAAYGFSLLWLAWITFPMMAAVQAICARIGSVSGRGIASLIKTYYPSWVVYPVCLLLLAANTINIGADLGAMAASINMFTGLPPRLVVGPVALAIVVLMVFTRYRTVVTIFKWLTLSLFAYVITAFLVKANWADVLHHTFIPEFRSDGAFVAMVVAIFGTTISPYLFFWQASQEVEEDVAKGKESVRQRIGTTDVDMEERHMDVNVGMGISNLVMFFIILTTGATLFASGKNTIASANDAALALEPLAGNAAQLLFGLGLLGTGLLAIPVLAGSASYAVSEAFKWRVGLDRPVHTVPQFYGVMVLATVVGLALDFTSINPIDALVLTAVVNGVVAPILLVLVMLIANNKRIMLDRANGAWSNVLGWFTTLVMAVAAVALFLTLGK